MEKYGFVYIWYDRKHKRYYVGCRWGNINDGYICSSVWMKQGYKHRPQDFKRRILKTNIEDRKQLLEEEYKWLQLIKSEELGKRYYNLHNHRFGHWSSNLQSKLTVGQKISASPLRNQRISEANKGRIISEEIKEKLRQANKKQFENPEQREIRRQKSKEQWADPQYRQHMSDVHKGQIPAIKDKTHSEESKIKMSEAHKGKCWSEKRRKAYENTKKL